MRDDVVCLIDEPGPPPQAELCAVAKIATIDASITAKHVVGRECIDLPVLRDSAIAEHNGQIKLVTIDIDDSGWKQTLADYSLRQSLLDRIHFIAGDSVGKETWKSLQPHVRNKKVLVILDSLHSRSHVLKELNLYSQLVPVGSYIVVNDTHLDGTEWVKPGRGPYAAVREFAAAHPEFEIVQQRFMVSCIHQGVLKRLR